MTITTIIASAANGSAGFLRINTAAGGIPAPDHVELFARFQLNYMRKAVEVQISVFPSRHEYQWRMDIAARTMELEEQEPVKACPSKDDTSPTSTKKPSPLPQGLKRRR